VGGELDGEAELDVEGLGDPDAGGDVPPVLPVAGVVALLCTSALIAPA
jgi:hypothetical protein